MDSKMNSKAQSIVSLVAVVSILSFHWDADAYLNPGTGSMILQALIAGIAVVAVTVKLYWYKLIAFIKGETLEEEEEDLLAGLDLDSEEAED